jgi:hypothetical protein
MSPRVTRHGLVALASALLSLGASACARQALPDPRLAAQRWAAAVEAGNAREMYSLLSNSARQSYGQPGVERLLASDRKELVALARVGASSSAVLATTADVAFEDHRTARVVFEGGEFRVAAAGALPAGAATPRDALNELRSVLAQRSFAGLLRVLTRDSARTLDGGLAELVDALAEAQSVEIDVEGRRAKALLPGGHTVTLEREDGIWRVKEFD